MRSIIVLAIVVTALNIAIHYSVVKGLDSRLGKFTQEQKAREEAVIGRVGSLHDKVDFQTAKIYDFERILNKAWGSAVNCSKWK